MEELHPVLQPQYTIEILGPHYAGISSLVERIVKHKYTGTFNADGEYLFNYRRNGNILRFKLLIIYDHHMKSNKNADVRINICMKYVKGFDILDYSSCNIQLECTTKEDTLHKRRNILQHNDIMDVFHTSALKNTGINELMDSVADRIIQREYIQQKYRKTDNILDMWDENFEELYPCMLVGYHCTSILLPHNLKVLHPNTFYGIINQFDLNLKHTQIETILQRNICSNSIRSVIFPTTLKNIRENNFIDCKNITGIIDLSQTKIGHLKESFNSMKLERIIFPPSLTIISSCFNNFSCPILDFMETNLKEISNKCFKNYHGDVLFNSIKLVSVPTSFLPRFFMKDTIDMSHTSIAKITPDNENLQQILNPVNTIIFPNTLVECPIEVFEIANHPMTFDFSNTMIQKLLFNIGKDMINRLKEQKIDKLILPPTCKIISSSCLFWFTKNDIINLDKTSIEEIHVDVWIKDNYTTIICPNTLKTISNEKHIKSPFKELDLKNTKIEELGSEINGKLLEKLILPRNLKIISENCFRELQNLLHIDISNVPLVEIKNSAFKYCKVETLVFPSSLKIIGSSCFEGCSVKKYDLSTTTIRIIPEQAFAASNIESIILPSTLISIGARSFYNCKCLKKIDIPQNVAQIGKDALAKTAIKFILLPEKVKSYSHTIFDDFKLCIITHSTDVFSLNIEGNSSNTTIFCLENTEININVKLKIIRGINIIEPIYQQQDPSISEAVLDFNELVKVRTIMTTNYGRIVLMRDANGNMFVCKRYENRNEITEKGFLRELETQIVLKHPTILPLAGHFYLPGRNCNCICTKFCEMGTLADKMNNDPGFMTSSRRLICIIDTILAMIHISENEIIHRDIKPSNIFIDGEFFLVGDFGISKFEFDVHSEITGVVGTFGSQAPEVITSAEYSEKSDVFSCGMVFFELLTGQSVYVEGITPQVFNQRIIKGSHPVIPQDINNNARILLEMCLRVKKEDRRTFREILDFLLSVDFMIIDEFDDTVLKHIASLHKFL